MGKYLQIRVSASTYNEDEVKKAWPSLWNLIWGKGGDAVPKKGVMELALAVYDAVRAGLLEDKAAEALEDGADKADKLHHAIEKALSDRNPKEADRLSYELEDALDALEDIAKKF